jgi:hypothetical protein
VADTDPGEVPQMTEGWDVSGWPEVGATSDVPPAFGPQVDAALADRGPTPACYLADEAGQDLCTEPAVRLEGDLIVKPWWLKDPAR